MQNFHTALKIKGGPGHKFSNFYNEDLKCGTAPHKSEHVATLVRNLDLKHNILGIFNINTREEHSWEIVLPGSQKFFKINFIFARILFKISK